MFKIGNFVNVVYCVDSYMTFIAKIIGFDYDKEVVFVEGDLDVIYEVPFANVEAI